jgi:hypothetical protein
MALVVPDSTHPLAINGTAFSNKEVPAPLNVVYDITSTLLGSGGFGSVYKSTPACKPLCVEECQFLGPTSLKIRGLSDFLKLFYSDRCRHWQRRRGQGRDGDRVVPQIRVRGV